MAWYQIGDKHWLNQLVPTWPCSLMHICVTNWDDSFSTTESHPHHSDVIMSMMASQITSLTIIYSTVYSRCRSTKTSKLSVTGLCEGNSPVTGEFPTQRARNTENVSIWWSHHDVKHFVNHIFCANNVNFDFHLKIISFVLFFFKMNTTYQNHGAHTDSFFINRISEGCRFDSQRSCVVGKTSLDFWVRLTINYWS